MNKDSELEILCRNIIFLKNKWKLTQKELSEISGLSLYSIRRIQKGYCPDTLTVDVLFNLSKYYGIKISSLFDIMQ